MKIKLLTALLFAATLALAGCTTTTISVKDGAKTSRYSRTAIGTNLNVGKLDADLVKGTVAIDSLTNDQKSFDTFAQLLLAVARAQPAAAPALASPPAVSLPVVSSSNPSNPPVVNQPAPPVMSLPVVSLPNPSNPAPTAVATRSFRSK